jgi:hypothetical protein
MVRIYTGNEYSLKIIPPAVRGQHGRRNVLIALVIVRFLARHTGSDMTRP